MRHREDEIIRAWHRGWTYFEDMSHDRATAISCCPYSRSYPRLRQEWIGGWDAAAAAESSAEAEVAAVNDYQSEEYEASFWNAEERFARQQTTAEVTS